MRLSLLWPTALACVALAGCKNESTPLPDGGTPGDGTVTSVAAAATGGTAFATPLDAALSPDGKTVFFTALTDETAAVFRVPAAGGTPTTLATADAPFGVDVSSDGTTVLVADTGYESPSGEVGAVLSVPAGGGTLSPLAGSVGYAPRALVVVGDQVYFSGLDRTDGSPGVFRSSATGGMVTAVLKAGLYDPAGLSVASNGDVYALDLDGADATTRRIVRIRGGALTTLVGNLPAGYPAGLALSQDGSALLYGAIDPATGKDVLWRFILAVNANGEPSTTGVATFSEPAGMHRARNADSYAFVDTGANGSGTVFVINPL